MLRALHAMRGGEGAVQLPCLCVIEAINCRLAKELGGCGIEGPLLDMVLVDFLDYVFRWQNTPSLEVAWYEYKVARIQQRIIGEVVSF
ncbi:hypothetical protein BDW75DRAFT_212175 [Aspergillus navahoensis]